ncbi:MAG: pyruvate dehydrogenase (acetyl-transferring) E1 component subunit alpha [Chloroflexi bacterium]|nr:pyruvate dehydrogenase (acetyl-transferring) E1 component subunit alpha [Chloroflexota bacterium]
MQARQPQQRPETLPLPKEQLMEFYTHMLLIRRFEEMAAQMYARGRIGGFLHLYIGEEAVAVGSIAALETQDYIVTHYREHGHALARSMDPNRIMAELFGKATGTSGGKGGSMHLFDASRSFLGGYAIVGGMMPIATGLGLASSYLGEDRITLCYFGDGAVNQGEFHEALNLAAIWNLPVLFFLENNGYGMGTRVDRVCAVDEIHTHANIYGIPSRKIDGMDVLTVYEATKEAVEQVRSGKGPFFLEALTYRFRGHSMADPVEYRQRAEEEQWKARDPIDAFRTKLEGWGVLTEQEREAVEGRVDDIVDEAVRFAEDSPTPPPEALAQHLYAEKE